ncbi:MAG: hypothetical protein J5714_05120 [Alphaproteobacteria bacterium]|nr:hypothetical protein [Alphaproteobacteria bacterium]
MRISGKLCAFALCVFIVGIAYAETTDADKKTVASKAYVDTKQDIITTGLVSLGDDWFEDLPSVVSFDSTSGLVGNKYGILDVNGSMNYIDDGWPNYIGEPEVEYLIPTVGAVGRELQHIWDLMPDSWTALTWVVNNDNGVNRTNAINAYNSTFGNGTNNWAGTSTDLITGQFLANSLALKQNKLPEQDDNLIPGQAGSVLAPTTAGNVAQVALWNADGGDSAAWNIDDYYTNSADRAVLRASIPTIGAVEVGLNTKQDPITTGLVEGQINQQQTEFPALVSYDSTDGLTGNKIGLLTQADVVDYVGDWDDFALDDNITSSHGMDSVVPTVKAVANAIQQIFWDNSIHSDAIDAYSTSFTGTTDNWPSDNPTRLVNGNTFARALALKQNKLPRQTTTTNFVPMGAQTITLATSANGAPGTRYITAGGSVGLTTRSGAPAIIGYVNGTAVADSTAMGTFTTGTFGANSATNQNHIKKALVSLELLKDVYSELNTKITNNALPTGTTGTVVTYNGTNATTGVQEFTETAVASAASYDSTTGALDNGDNIANVTFVETKQKKKTCAGYESGHENDPDYCWLWNFPE